MKIKKDDTEEAGLSAEETIVVFNPRLPLLREAVPASLEEDDADLSKCPFELAFSDENARHVSWQACEARLFQQCQAGARMGCSIAAARKCKMPWWKALFKFGKISSDAIAERNACEEREMDACMIASGDKCSEYAKATCAAAYSGTRIAKQK